MWCHSSNLRYLHLGSVFDKQLFVFCFCMHFNLGGIFLWCFVYLSGDWKNVEFKEFNFNAKGQPIEAGHLHPLNKARICSFIYVHLYVCMYVFPPFNF